MTDFIGGGGTKKVITLVNSISDLGFSVDLILSNAVGPECNRVSPKVRVIDFKQPRVYLTVFKLKNYLKTERPRVLFSVYNLVNDVSLLAKLLAKVETRVIVSVVTHVTSHVAGLKNIKNVLMWKIILFLDRVLYKRAAKIITVSNIVAEDLISLIGVTQNKIKVIYNPTLRKEIFELADRPVDHPWFNEVRSTQVILTAGRLSPEKNFTLLIKAFAKLVKQIQARLIILGEGSLHDALIQLIKFDNLSDKIMLLPYIENPYCYMKNCDLYVSSSNYEGLSNSIIEAVALSPRVVATDCPGGSREILDGGRLGRLVPVNDVDGLAKAMIESLSSPPMQPDFVFLSRFDRDVVVKEYLQALLN